MSVFSMAASNPALPTYPLQRSVRLRSSASAFFNRTPASASNRKTWTWSGWVKRGALGVNLSVMGAQNAATAGTQRFNMYFAASTDVLVFSDDVINTSTSLQFITTQVFRDPSAWYHIVLAMDTTQATSTNRVKLYINGVQVTAFSTATYPALNFDTAINNNVAQYLGYYNNLGTTIFYYDGYLEEINFIDGQALTPSSFGAYNSYGVWSPAKYTGTYGTNGFYLNFQDNSTLTTTVNVGIGADSSGNGNYWTSNNISLTAGATYDSMLDVPTNTSNTNANYAVINPISAIAFPITNGNLSIGAATTSNRCAKSSIAVSSGKWYWEFKASVISISGQIAGICSVDALFSGGVVSSGFEVGYYSLNGNKYVNGTGSAYGASWTASDTIGVALDVDGGTVTFYKNNVSQGSISITAGQTWVANWTGQNTTDAVNFTFGQQPFSYTPPTGFNRLNTYNLPDSIVPVGAQYMAATTYTGNGSTQAITNTVNGTSFQPDFVWVKNRTTALNHILVNSVVGPTLFLNSNTTSAESNTAGVVTALNSNGFSVGSVANVNQNTNALVGWQWRASNASAVTNTAGTITSSVSANQTAGFSIVTYTGTGANATVGHGLGVAPRMMIIKGRTTTFDWRVWFYTFATGFDIQLNSTTGATSAPTVYTSAPTSTVINIGTGSAVNQNAATYVAYCFAAVPGYSAFGSYTGNGSADGPFVYLGFRPRWVLIKRSDAASDWVILDTSRDSYNMEINYLVPNTSGAEASGASVQLDGLSNGFKIRGTWVGMNASGSTIIYACFAENPFKNSLAR
jgi:hypothetical protein